MHRVLVIVDMQNDFITGSLGNDDCRKVVSKVSEVIRTGEYDEVYLTRDTHDENYLDTQEGEHLPVRHCIKGTEGWQLCKEVAPLIPEGHIFDKPTFGSVELAEAVRKMEAQEKLEVELVGLCTDICVVSNALLLKAVLPEMKISVDASCCAGVTPQKHEAALETMRSCQIQGI